tara:strand:+ start:3113 stop:4360 length:1248 start_codon:yes stop_codon:yes gene_type:complete
MAKTSSKYGANIIPQSPGSFLTPASKQVRIGVSGTYPNRRYPDNKPVPAKLPANYNLPQVLKQRCGACGLFLSAADPRDGGYCLKWQALVRQKYWCKSWKSKITDINQSGNYKHLYTAGFEFVDEQGQLYEGWYHIHPDKGAMEGKVHQPQPHRRLTALTVDAKEYLLSVQGELLQPGSVPPVGQYLPWPTLKDFEKGTIKRAFIEKRNEPFIFEVNPKLAGKIHTKMGLNLYKLIKIDWYISGPTEFLEKKNSEVLAEAEENTLLLKGMLQNLTQLSDLRETAARPTEVSNLYHPSPISKGALNAAGNPVNENATFNLDMKTGPAFTKTYQPAKQPINEPPPSKIVNIPTAPFTRGTSGKSGKTGTLVDVAGVTVSAKKSGLLPKGEPIAKVSVAKNRPVKMVKVSKGGGGSSY